MSYTAAVFVWLWKFTYLFQKKLWSDSGKYRNYVEKFENEAQFNFKVGACQ